MFSIIFLGISCTKEHDIVDIDEEPFTPVSNIELGTLVVTVNIDEPFTCTINDQVYSNDRPGVILIENLLLKKEGNLILIKSDEYFDETRYVIPSLGAHAYLEVDMTRLNSLANFNAKEGGAISLSRLEIEIAPNMIVDAQGNPYEGEVNVALKNTFSGAYSSQIRKFPQNLKTINDELTLLHFLDGYDLEIADQMMNPLFVKEGFSASFKIKIRDETNQTIPDILEMRHFDNEKSTWEKIGSVEKNGDWWTGTIYDFGKINVGTPYNCRPAQVKLITEEGLIVPNKFVLLTLGTSTPFSLGFSDNEGNIRIHIPLDKEFSLATLERNAMLDPIKYQKYDIVNMDDEELLILDDFVLNSEEYQRYTGFINDCNGQLIKESAFILEDAKDIFSISEFTSYFFSNEEGFYDFARPKNSSEFRTVRSLDISTNTQSIEYSIPNNVEYNVDFENFPICNEFETYITYKIEENIYTYVFNSNYTSTFLDPNYASYFSADALNNSSESSQITFTIEHGSVFYTQSTHQIKDMKIRFENGPSNFSFDCTEDCNHLLVIKNITNEYIEGIIKYTDDTNEQITVGTFRLPKQ